ncbi:MAG: hypothetical protein ACYC7A_08015 [Thermoanaerobaculia bacterium]
MKPTKAKTRKQQASFNLPVDLIDELRDAAVHFSGPPHRMTLASIAEDALRRELERIRQELNRGRAIPKYQSGSLKPGRPIKAGRRD